MEKIALSKHSDCLRIVFLALIFCFNFLQISTGQSSHSALKNGDKLYDEANFTEAEKMYREAATIKESVKSKFNLGNSLFEQGNFEASAEEFQRAANLATDTMIRSKAYYNKGNSLLSAGKYPESLNAYKQSLILNPKDDDAKQNFMMVKQKMKQKQEQDQENQDQNQDENENQDEQEQQPENNEDQQQDKENQEKQKQEKEDEQEEPSDGDEEPERDLTKEEALQLLESVDRADSEVQKKLQKSSANKKKPEKEW